MQGQQPDTALYRDPRRRKTTVDLMGWSAGIGGAAPGGSAQPAAVEATVEPAQATPAAVKLGWFNGVMVPVLLNIWGVIMFLRLGWVVGQAGTWGAVGIIVLANVVTGITALSLCAIATNGEVKGGGAYYLISRALGPAFGGTIGILFFIAQAIATSLYVIGFSESITDLMEMGGTSSFTGDSTYKNDLRVIGIGTCVVLLGVAMVGIGWYAKTQVGLLVILVLAITALFFGSFFPAVPDEGDNNSDGFIGYSSGLHSSSSYTHDFDSGAIEMYDFFTVFAVFFPAVTGIMAGANLSGDLKNPSHAIPKGTLGGIVFTFFSYVGLAILIGATCVPCVSPAIAAVNICQDVETSTGDMLQFGTKEWGDFLDGPPASLAHLYKEDVTSGSLYPEGGLIFNNLIMTSVAIWGPFVLTGIFAATLSSALASLVGAPRILQAVSKDELFPFRAINYFAQLPPLNSTPAGKAKKDDDVAGPKSPPRGTIAAGQAKAVPDSVAAVALGQAEDEDGAAAEGDENRESPEPKRGYVLTFVIACLAVLIGDLNAVAPLISNFFMISYALTNYACFAVTMSETPGWRPTFKYYNKWLSLIGAALCIAIMFAFDWLTSLISVVIAVLIFKYLEYTDPPKNWGPAADAARYLSALRSLYKLRKVKTDVEGRAHVKTYRPQYLVMVEDPRSDAGKSLVSFVSKLYKGRGIAFVTQVMTTSSMWEAGSGTPWDEASMSSIVADRVVSMVQRQRMRNQKLLDRAVVDADTSAPVMARWRGDEQPEAASAACLSDGSAAGPTPLPGGKGEYGQLGVHHVGNKGLTALALQTVQRELLHAEVVAAPSVRAGLLSLMQLSGVAAMRPNIVMVGYREGWWWRTPPATQQANARARLSVVSEDGSGGDATEEPEVTTVSVAAPRNASGRLGGVVAYEGLIYDAFMARKGVAVMRDTKCLMLDGYVPPKTSNKLQNFLPGPMAKCLGVVPPERVAVNQPQTADGTTVQNPTAATGGAERRLSVDLQNSRTPIVSAHGEEKTIDVWWLADDGGLAVLLPHLLRQNPQFAGHRLRVFTTGSPDSSNDATVAAHERSLRLGQLLAKLRFRSEALSMKLSVETVSDSSLEEFERIYPGMIDQRTVDKVRSTGAAAAAMPKGGSTVAPDGVDVGMEEVDEKAGAEGAAGGSAGSPANGDKVLLSGKKTSSTVEEGQGGVTNGDDVHAHRAWLQCEGSKMDKDMRRNLTRETMVLLRSMELIRSTSTDSSLVFIVMPIPRKNLPPGLYSSWMEVLSRGLPPTVLLRGNGDSVVTLGA